MPLFQKLRLFRQQKISQAIFKGFKKVLPAMSATEKDAIEAGTTWWDAELFSGKPNWEKLLSYPKPQLSPEEQAFFDNEVEVACSMVDDWKVTTKDYNLDEATWTYIKENRFLGMIIPKQYGGLGFSAFAHSEIMTKLSTRSSALAVSVMVPNSLGPGELLVHYGTQEQRDYYLPRLANGQEIPAFALTSPWAGSDAAAIPDSGVICKGLWNGQEVIGMKISWNKRYITLAPVCTLLGLAFRLYDPDGLLGDKKDIGITCALVPHDHPGVKIGRRHFPLNAAFMNGPTSGNDVFMPLDFIIGGPQMAGKGWRMLMECLAAGRSISLPSSNVGMSQMTSLSVSAYSRVRKQFNVSINSFEGIEEALGRIGGTTYLCNATRIMTAGSIDLGEKPSVISSIAKYHVTEKTRKVVNDGMDVIGGKGICLGPSNVLGRAYQQIPVGITVEGANILTRSLIIFGQGAIRCHPYVLKEMQATQEPDASVGLEAFDKALWGHIGFACKNKMRALASGLFSARVLRINVKTDDVSLRYFQQLTRLSSALAIASDVCMLVFGGDLKKREKISARLGDVLSYLYLASCALKYYQDQGKPAQDLPLLHWAVQDCLYHSQEALYAVYDNFPNRFIGNALRLGSFPWGRVFKAPSDKLSHEITQLLTSPSEARNRLTANCYIPNDPNESIAVLEKAFSVTLKAEPIEAKIRQLEKAGKFTHMPKANVRDIAELANDMKLISPAEYEIVKERNRLRDIVIHVDDLPFDLSNPEAFSDTRTPSNNKE